MKRSHPLLYLLTLVSLFAAGGSSCPARPPNEILPPQVPPPQTLSEVIEAINLNSQRIHQLQASQVTLDLPGAPRLRANLALERPRRFRMRAELTAVTGPELDMGSNDDYFWMWMRRDDPPTVYFARHDQYAQRPARSIIPIEPFWLIEALGIVYLDPADHHEGPFSRRPGLMEVHTKTPSANGDITKVTIIDENHRWVVEQHIYDSDGRLIASAKAKRHRYYPNEGVSLPRHVEIFLPTIQLSFQIDVENYIINGLYGDPNQLWQPQLSGYPLQDVADPSFQSRLAPTSSAEPSGQYSPYQDFRSGTRPRYRGIETRR